MTDLRAPFPYFGGKARASSLVWSRFGRPVNYVEPFFGSGAVLLSCPDDQLPRVETVNDLNCYVSNFWRAVRTDPEAVAREADYPVIETDLHARHRWLLARGPQLRALLDDPEAFDARAAAWWVWGASAWIGSGWCDSTSRNTRCEQRPDLNGDGSTIVDRGIHAAGMRVPSARLPDLSGGTQWGTDEPNARAGRGVHGATMRGPSQQLPELGGSFKNGEPVTNYGRGLNSLETRTRLYDLFAALSRRLRHVRVACGDWSRICTPAVTYRHGLTAVFLDPPYDGFEHLYGPREQTEQPLSARVRAWALEHGARPDMRIALCGYEGEHDALTDAGWECVAWKAKGGYANQGDTGNENSRRERIWFSPACLRPGVTTGQIVLPGCA